MTSKRKISKELMVCLVAAMMSSTIIGGTASAAVKDNTIVNAADNTKLSTANCTSTSTTANGTAANGATAKSTAANSATTNGATANGTTEKSTAANSATANGTTAKNTAANSTTQNSTAPENFTLNDMKNYINNMDKSTDKTNLDKLLTTYQSKIAATAKAKTALLTAMKKAGLSVNNVTTSTGLDTALIKREISTVSDPTLNKSLTKLLTNYETAVKAEATAKAALVSATQKVYSNNNAK